MKMPWVILSSGVDADIFGRAVSIAMKGGASGFWLDERFGRRLLVHKIHKLCCAMSLFLVYNGWQKLSMKVSRNANPLWISILENNNG